MTSVPPPTGPFPAPDAYCDSPAEHRPHRGRVRGTATVADGSLLPCRSYSSDPELYSGEQHLTGHNPGRRQLQGLASTAHRPPASAPDPSDGILRDLGALFLFPEFCVALLITLLVLAVPGGPGPGRPRLPHPPFRRAGGHRPAHHIRVPGPFGEPDIIVSPSSPVLVRTGESEDTGRTTFAGASWWVRKNPLHTRHGRTVRARFPPPC